MARKPAPRAKAPAAIKRRSSSTPKIDMHAHMGLDELGEFVAANPGPSEGPGAQRGDQFNKRISDAMRPRQTDPRVRLEDMDEMGVDIQIVSVNLPPAAYWAPIEAGLAIRSCATSASPSSAPTTPSAWSASPSCRCRTRASRRRSSSAA